MPLIPSNLGRLQKLIEIPFFRPGYFAFNPIGSALKDAMKIGGANSRAIFDPLREARQMRPEQLVKSLFGFHGLALKNAFANPSGVRLRSFFIEDHILWIADPKVGITGVLIGLLKTPQRPVFFVYGSP